jgi:GNAT superfamily N-acetyltransferase
MLASTRMVHIRPVTTENWQAFVQFFEAKGSPHFCWCMSHRVRSGQTLNSSEKKASMETLVAARIPVGVLADIGNVPVGWCSIAPRENYRRLDSSRTMPRATAVDLATWTVLCFFVARLSRKQGVMHALLAVAYARAHGAKVVEGYPFDSAGISSTHRGHSSLFKAAGFLPDGKRWSLRCD